MNIDPRQLLVILAVVLIAVLIGLWFWGIAGVIVAVVAWYMVALISTSIIVSRHRRRVRGPVE